MLPRQSPAWNRPRSHGSDRRWQAVRTLFSKWSIRHSQGETVGSITEKVNRLRIEAGEKPFKPRKVAAILKNLGVKTASLGSWGRVSNSLRTFAGRLTLWPDSSGLRAATSRIGWQSRAVYRGPACDLCLEFDLTAGLRPSPVEPTRLRAKWFSASARKRSAWFSERAERDGELVLDSRMILTSCSRRE